jgi:hypothetical protein
MFLKLLTIVIIVLAAMFMVAGRRPALPRRRDGAAPARVPHADDLVRCGRCGLWQPAGQRCGCAGAA